MSREWYIKTDKRHVDRTFGDIDTTPMSFSERLRSNYKKYILWTVELAVLVALVVLAFPLMFPKNTADYTVTLVTASPVSEKGLNALKTTFRPHAVDRNGDGNVEIAVRQLVVNTAEEGLRDPGLEQLIATLNTDEYTLLAMEPAVYKRYIKAYTAENASLFEAVTEDTAGTLHEQSIEEMPTLLLGVRALPKAGKDAAENQQAHLQMFRSLVNAQKQYEK